MGASLVGHRKTVIELGFGVLKQQGVRQFRTRGIGNVANDITLAIPVYNLTRVHALGVG